MAGPGRATSGRPTLQTSSNQRDSNHLARTPVTNVVNLRPKTLILSEKALGLTTFVTTDQKSTRKTPPIDDVCNNTQRSAPKSQHDKPDRIGGVRRTRLQRPWAAAGPGRASSRRTQPHISDQAPPVWRAPEGPGPGCGARGRRRGQGGPRADAPSHTPAHQAPLVWRAPEGLVGLAAVPVGGGGARAGLEIDHSEPQARVWRSRGRAAAHGHTTQPGPSTHTKTPTRNRVGVSEPPVGIEPTTYSLRVNRSAD